MEERAGCLVIGHPDPSARAELAYQFRRLGWETRGASSGPEVRRLASKWQPAVVLLATDLDGESGWLTAAKMCVDRPGPEIVMLERNMAPEHLRFARFVGAALVVSERAGIRAVLDAVAQVAPAPVVG